MPIGVPSAPRRWVRAKSRAAPTGGASCAPEGSLCARLGFLLLASLLAPSLAPAQDWPHWRGPRMDGSSPATNLPSSWTTEQGVRWVTPLSGLGSSSPVVVGDRVYVTGEEDDTNHTLSVYCVDAANGRRLWQCAVGHGREVAQNGMATPSPVADASRVYALFGNGVLAAVGADGNVAWTRDLERDFGPIAP